MKCSDCDFEMEAADNLVYASYPLKYLWKCPKCGAVMSPNTNVCLFCSPNQNLTVTY